MIRVNGNPSWEIQALIILKTTIVKPRSINMINKKSQKNNNKYEERELRNKLELIGVADANGCLPTV